LEGIEIAFKNKMILIYFGAQNQALEKSDIDEVSEPSPKKAF